VEYFPSREVAAVWSRQISSIQCWHQR